MLEDHHKFAAICGSSLKFNKIINTNNISSTKPYIKLQDTCISNANKTFTMLIALESAESKAASLILDVLCMPFLLQYRCTDRALKPLHPRLLSKRKELSCSYVHPSFSIFSLMKSSYETRETFHFVASKFQKASHTCVTISSCSAPTYDSRATFGPCRLSRLNAV